MSSTVASAQPQVSEDAGFFASASVVRKTGSYPRQRAVAVAGTAAMLFGALVAAIGLTVGISFASKAASGVVFLVAVLAIAFLLMPYIDKKLFAMRAAYAYIATEVIVRNRAIPDGDTAGMAQGLIEQQLGALGPVCDAHNDVQRIVRAFFRGFDKLDQMLPIDLGPVRSALAWVVDRVAPRIADICLSHAFARGERDFTNASKDAVALVAQNPKAIVGIAVRAYVTERTLSGIAGFVFSAVCCAGVFFAVHAATGSAMSDSGLPAEGAEVASIFAAIFSAALVGLPLGALLSWFLRAAFLEPVGLAMILTRFHAVTAGQRVDPAMRARIDQIAGNADTSSGLASFFS